MAQININTGSVANDGTGDTIRQAFTSVNSNFTELYSNMTAVVGADASALQQWMAGKVHTFWPEVAGLGGEKVEVIVVQDVAAHGRAGSPLG